MHVMCCLKTTCVSLAVANRHAPVLTPRVWTNWFVPSSVHLESGYRYGMHTSPGGRWCHCGTCPLHSPPVSTAPIYLHSLFFQRRADDWFVYQLMEFVISAVSLSCMITANNLLLIE